MKNITVPPLGESVSEATIAKWYKNVGDQVVMDEILLELETEKVTLEVNAPCSGVVTELLAKQGDVVPVGALLGHIKEGQVAESASAGVPAQASASAVENKAPITEVIAAPSAAKLAKESGQDLGSVVASGKDGRVTKADVLQAVTKSASISIPAAPVLPQVTGERVERRVKMSRLRQTIAARLKESQNTAAILSTFNEVDMSEIMRIRQQHQESFTKKHGIKLGFMSFFTKAVVQALKNIPNLNAQIVGDEIVYKDYYDIGVAVGTENGLVVPVLRNVEYMSLADIELTLNDMALKARDGKLLPKDMTGGTFSITNGGTYGSLLSTPIINPPQSGILGMHNIVKRPVVINDNIVIRPMMYIALSYDHRIIDGKEAVTFLVQVKKLCENPELLLLDL